MKLLYSPHSPFARKVRIVAAERGLADRITLVPVAPSPVQRDATAAAVNPLAQVPTLLRDGEPPLSDSRVICEYLDALDGAVLFPPAGEMRWQALSDQSIADGMTAAAQLARHERQTRPQSLQWADWSDGQWQKVTASLDHFSAAVEHWGDRFDIGVIALICGLAYLDHRFAAFDWRQTNPTLQTWFDGLDRPSLHTTRLGA